MKPEQTEAYQNNDLSLGVVIKPKTSPLCWNLVPHQIVFETVKKQDWEHDSHTILSF